MGIKENISKNIKMAVIDTEINTGVLAKKIAVERSTIYKWVDRGNASHDNIEKLAKALNMHEGWFYQPNDNLNLAWKGKIPKRKTIVKEHREDKKNVVNYYIYLPSPDK